MSSNDREPATTDSEPVKRFRSVKEYREKKKIQRMNSGQETHSDSPNAGNRSLDAKEEFTRILKDTVAGICYSRLGDIESTEDIPEWRIVCRIISQTLLDKEARLPAEVRFNLSDTKLRDATVRRIKIYTTEYLDRKYP